MTALAHDTVVIERTFEASVARVFAAFADPVARAKWGVPSDTAVLLYDATDFRVGGHDRFRCGAKSDPKYHGEVRYLHIENERHIIYAETIDADGSRLSASLNTVEFMAIGQRTALKLTVQVAAIGGADMIAGTRFGHGVALTKLADFLGSGA
ncbi:MAG: SRPBCC domain-containing protein [Hyphomicrobium sp.]